MMKRTLAAVVVVLVLSAARFEAAFAGTPSEPHETQRGETLRAVYFPFLALGHGVMAIVKYGIGYPIYYLVKPVYDFAYESSEDPAELQEKGD